MPTVDGLKMVDNEKPLAHLISTYTEPTWYLTRLDRSNSDTKEFNKCQVSFAQVLTYWKVTLDLQSFQDFGGLTELALPHFPDFTLIELLTS